jgi:hemophore
MRNVLSRGLLAVFGVVCAGGATALIIPSATAASDPCAASEVAKTIGSVATAIGGYLDAHPQTNQALTTISQQQPGPQSLGALKTYFDANPQAATDMQQLQSPLVALSSRCKLPLTLPQVLGLVQSAQQGGAGLPSALSTVQSVGAPAAVGRTPSTGGPAPVQGVSGGPGAGPGSALAGLP